MTDKKQYHKEASRKHYLANKEVIIARSKATKLKLFAYVRELKDKTPCKDCGHNYPYYVMDFDHLPEFEKITEVAKIINSGSMKRLLDEIAKCDLVCSNCHRIRTFKRSKQV